MYTNYGAEDIEDEVDPMEELLAQHRKEKKALKEKALSMKKIAKSGNKQKQKETNAEIERLESEMAARHEREISNLKVRQCTSVLLNIPSSFGKLIFVSSFMLCHQIAALASKYSKILKASLPKGGVSTLTLYRFHRIIRKPGISAEALLFCLKLQKLQTLKFNILTFRKHL
ncbi:unnamed protein product [Cylicostephanus goldi]|uniref:Uncharacterized protein n=1 Tax=Cylicostephanus goldi TaxID=71465 RepID=A0A3P6T5K3_CYLGO|nr:unnamed protein product [Cylicostephanus goldi]